MAAAETTPGQEVRCPYIELVTNSIPPRTSLVPVTAMVSFRDAGRYSFSNPDQWVILDPEAKEHLAINKADLPPDFSPGEDNPYRFGSVLMMTQKEALQLLAEEGNRVGLANKTSE